MAFIEANKTNFFGRQELRNLRSVKGVIIAVGALSVASIIIGGAF